MGDYLLSTFVMGVLGGFDMAEFEKSDNPVVAKGMFLFLSAFVSIILLNLLIALMGSTYEKVSETSTLNLRLLRAQWISRNLRTISWFKPLAKKIQNHVRYFYMITPVFMVEAG